MHVHSFRTLTESPRRLGPKYPMNDTIEMRINAMTEKWIINEKRILNA